MYNKVTVFVLFIIGLAYILSPGPSSVTDFPAIPDSVKSNEPGDTIQVPNIAAYFSDYDREKITYFYKDAYRKLNFTGFIPPMSLSYPPEFAKIVIRDEQKGTFLEEYVYPLRGSIYVNGYEPFIDNEIKKREHNFIADHIHIDGRYFVSKTTIRYYPADFFVKTTVYLGLWISIFAIFIVSKKALKEV